MGKYKKLTDQQLVELYRKGNNSAFNTLLFRYKDLVFRYIFSLVRDKELAEDVFQDAFIKAVVLLKNGNYKENGYFSTWLCTIAKNLVFDYFRKTKASKTCSNEDFEFDCFAKHAIEEENIQDNIIKEEIRYDLICLIDMLPQTQKQIVKMRFFENMSFKQISENLNISINTALGRARYATLNIKKIAEERKMLCY